MKKRICVRATDLENGDTVARWLIEPLWAWAAVGVLDSPPSAASPSAP